MPRPLLVELVGPAGAGKSTVYDALLEHGFAAPPLLRRRPYALGLARQLAATVAALARRGVLNRRWNRDQLVMTAYLRALPPVLEGWREPGSERIVFDQGPIFTLTRSEMLDPRLADWWEASLTTWTSLLDAVVWLDAPGPVLAQRIQGRPKAHRLKGVEDRSAVAALVEDRAVFERVLARLEAAPAGPAVVRFDTSRRTAAEIAADIAGRIRSP